MLLKVAAAAQSGAARTCEPHIVGGSITVYCNYPESKLNRVDSTFGGEELIKVNSRSAISRRAVVVFPVSPQRDLIIAFKIYSIAAN